MTYLTDFLDAEVALAATEIPRLVPTPVEPFGYGTDLSCVADLDPALDDVDPLSPAAVGEALVRRITTDRGSLPDDPDYGIDVRKFLNRGTTQVELVAMAGQIRSEMLKDDRVVEADVSVAHTLATRTLSITATITHESATGDAVFDFTLAVTDGAALLEAINVRSD